MQKLKIFMDDVNRRLTELENFAEQMGTPEDMNSRIKTIEERLFTNKDKFTVPEACEYIGIAESTMYKLTCTKQIPHFKRGKFIYFEREELDKWMSSHRVASVEETVDEYFEQHPDLLNKSNPK